MKNINLLDLPFVGRQSEIGLLNKNIDSVFTNRGKCLLITGEPGIGKSRLIVEFLAQLKKTVTALRINLEPDKSKQRDIVEEAAKSYLRGAVRSSKVITRIIDPAMYRAFKRSIPELDIYYPFEMESADPAGERPEIKEMLYRFLNNLSALAPVVFVIDDFDRSGNDGQTLIEYLLPHIPALPLFLILAAQDQPDIRRWFDRVRSPSMEKQSLGRLREEDVSRINQLVFERSLDEDFMKWMTEKTGGLPLFLKELLLSLFERGVIFFDGERNRWRTIDSYSKVSIPGRIGDIISERLGKLSETEMNFLKTASVMEGEFDIVMPVLRSGQAAASSLARAGLIRKKNNTFAFVNPMVRDLLYSGIRAGDRTRLHRKFATYFEKKGDEELAARHYLAAGARSTNVQGLIIAAAKKSRALGAYDRSVMLLERALDIASANKKNPAVRLPDIYLDLCTSLFLAEKYERLLALQPAVEMHAVNKLPGQRHGQRLGAYYSQLIQSLIHAGRYKDGLAVAQKAINGMTSGGAGRCDEARLEIATHQASIYRSLGQVDEALALALDLKKECADAASTLNRHGICKLLGSLYNEKRDFARAIEFREQALAAAKLTGMDHLIAAAQGNLGVSMTSIGQLARGMELMRMYQDYNISAGRIRAEIVSYIHMAQIYFNQGCLDQAEAEYKKGLERSAKHGDFLREAVCELHYRYGTFLVMTENYPDARRHLEISMKLAQEMKNPAAVLYSMLNMGFLYAAQKDRTGLSRTISGIKTDFRGKYENEVTFAVMEGFQSIFSGRSNAGLKKLDEVFARLELQQAPAGLFRLLYLCAAYLKSNKATRGHSEMYFKKAVEIAGEYQMTGWMKKLAPGVQDEVIDPLRIHCLGSLRVEHPRKGWVDIDQLQRVKPSQLLAILTCGALTKARYTRERIGALLWPDLPTAKMVNNFHVCLFQLKEYVGSEYVKYVNGNYLLENTWFDVQEFKNMIKKADVLLREGKMHSAEEAYEAASELYAGDFLEDLYDPWIDDIRAELKSLRIDRLLTLGEIFIKKLKFEQAIRTGQDVLKSDALSEEGHRFLIKCYMLNGEKAKAVDQYNRCVELFRRELDSEPSEETLKLRDKIK